MHLLSYRFLANLCFVLPFSIWLLCVTFCCNKIKLSAFSLLISLFCLWLLLFCFFFHQHFTFLHHLCPESSLSQEEGPCCLWDVQLCTNTCGLLSFLLIDVLLLSLPFAQVHCSHSLCFPLLNPTLQITASCPSFAFYLPTPSCGGGVFFLRTNPFSLLLGMGALFYGVSPNSIRNLLGFHFRS